MNTRPDEVLEQAQEDEARKSRARLKIFFGAAPGVGKTYAMLSEAQELLLEGVDVVAGFLDTHGRPESQALTAGLEVLPRKSFPYRGATLEEFDLEAALARKPKVILVDELAHANAPGALHAKRWQDVWDLLDAGIDVHTTLNVQHLESLRDVVAQITGVLVRENIPDKLLSRADQIELVDIPPEELIERLQEGKVYVPEQARHANDRFFRRGNLMALRELALRRTAEQVDADMRRYMNAKGIGKTWAAGERLMVCISSRPESAHLIRAAKRMAESLDAPWIVAYIESPRYLSYSEASRVQIEEHLRQAERLGAETVVLQGSLALAEDLVALALRRNVTKILVGKPTKPRWLEFFTGSLLADLIRASGAIDIHVIAGEEKPGKTKPVRRSASHTPVGHFLWSFAVVAVATGLALLMARYFELADVIMVYILAILVVASRVGRLPSLLAAVLSVVALDFFIIPPVYSLVVQDTRHSATFLVLLVMGIVIGNLTERIRQQAKLARFREQRTLALFKLSADLARSGNTARMVSQAIRSVAAQFQSHVLIFLPDSQGRLKWPPADLAAKFSPAELGVAQWAFDHHEVAGLETDTLAGAKALYLPLTGTNGPIGVMGVLPEDVPRWTEPDQRHLLEAFSNQTALALERTLLSERSLENQRQADREHLRNALLSSVSHDLRTPLGGITGAASTLLEDEGRLTQENRRELLETIHEEAQRLHRLVSNLLDVTRIESGVLELKKEWVPVEELVGAALDSLGQVLGTRGVKLDFPKNLPLVPVDPILAEQALINLLENAHKYSPPDQPIEVRAWATEKSVTLAILDHGPGIPAGEEERIFEKLVRLQQPGARPGAGLGLAICKGIMDAHEGRIQASNRPGGGAQFLMSLPLAPQPPQPPVEVIDHA
ncbi:sensor histidine kinase [Holophaga foetida]|uniref:sensor histidine kinase n=1 Tax=Holophaga foetida TaxID=35839 RepID=UPI00024732DC|nr:sensor histidine kinase KdpD [Holophaga foetida]